MKDEQVKVNEAVEEDEDLIELTDDKGRRMKFYHVGSTEFKDKWYACFMPAEKIEGLEDEEVVIFEVSKEEGTDEEILLPVEDEVILEAVFQQFCREIEEDEDAEEAESLEGGCGECCGCCGDCDGDDCEE